LKTKRCPLKTRKIILQQTIGNHRLEADLAGKSQVNSTYSSRSIQTAYPYFMKKSVKIMLALLGLAAMTLCSCSSTVAGMGKDIQKTGSAITRSVQ
jgi:predicted small secreted protein